MRGDSDFRKRTRRLSLRGYICSRWTQTLLLLQSCVTFFLVVCDTRMVDAAGNEVATISGGGAFGSDDDISFRQSFCERYKDLSGNASIGVKNALQGVDLTVSLEPSVYFIYDFESGIDPNYPGINARLLDTIAERGNFTWRQSFGIWTRDEKGNRSITELLQWGIEKYDLMVGQYTPSTERMNLGVSFVADGHFDGSLILARIVEPQEPTVDWFNWIKPFELSVWGVIIGVVVLSSITYQWIEHIGAERESDTLRKRTMDNLYLSSINFTGNYSYEPTTLGGRVFGFFFAFWAMLITATYTANLASLLVVDSLTEPKVKDIRDAFDKRLPICVQATSFAEEYLRAQYPEGERYLIPLAKDELYKALNGQGDHSGACELIVAYRQEFDLNLQRTETNPSCNMEWQGRQIKTLKDAYATKLDPGIRCTDLVNEVFSYYMKELEDEGLLEELWQEHNNFYGNDHCGLGGGDDDSEEVRRRLKASGRGGAAAGGAAAATSASESAEPGSEEYRLTLKDMAGTMLWQVIGSVISIAVAMLSGFDRKTKVKRTIKKRESMVASTEGMISSDGGNELDYSDDSDDSSVDDSLLQKQLGDLAAQLQVLNEAVQTMQESINQRKNQPKKPRKPRFRHYQNGFPTTGALSITSGALAGGNNANEEEIVFTNHNASD